MTPNTVHAVLRHCRIVFVPLLLLVAAPPAAAQDATVPWGFFNTRYDTRTSNFIYAGYGYGPVFAFGGVLANPRSGYTEVLGGAGAVFATGGLASMVGLAAAKAPEAWYAQLYYLPTFRLGPVTTRATMEWYFPLEATGVRQFSVSPVSLTVPLAGRLEGGVAVEFAAAQGMKSEVWVGPELRFSIPRATIGLDAFRATAEGEGRLRAFFNASF